MAKQAKINEWISEAGITADAVKYLKSDPEHTTPVVWRNCHRCGGAGVFQCFGHIYAGRCFACGGQKGHWRTLQKVAASARAATRRQDQQRAETQKGGKIRLDKKRVVARQARITLEQNVGLAKVLAKSKRGIMRSFAQQLAQRGSLSEKQIAAAFKVAKDIATQDAIVLINVPEGRGTVEGEIIMVKEYYNDYTGGEDLKMLVMDARGFKVFGTVPRSIIVEAERGVKVRFDAQLKGKELGYGFFKRPTKAEVLA